MQPEAPVQVEVPVLSVRRQARVLTLPLLLLIVIAAAGGYFVGALPEAWMNWAAGLGGVALALLLGIGPLLGWLTNRATITTRRVIIRRGFFVHRRTEVPLSRVREVRSKRGPIQRLFGSGDIELLVGTEIPTVLRDVPGPVTIIEALQELIEQNYLNAVGQAAHTGQAVPGWSPAGGAFGTPPGYARGSSSESLGDDTTRLP